MSASKLNEVVCPACRGALARHVSGALVCRTCERRFPVENGIPRLLTAADRDRSNTMRDSYEVQWGDFLDQVVDQDAYHFNTWETVDGERRHTVVPIRNAASEPQWVDLFLRDSGLPAEYFSGIRCLDAGCGYGRYSSALARLGADLVAIDLASTCVERVASELEDFESVSTIQAGVCHLPFPDESFDYVLCWGVLMLLPDPRPALAELHRVLRPGGRMTLHFYEFVNPLRIAIMWCVRRLVQALPPSRRMIVTDRFIMRHATRWTPYWYWRKLVTAFVEMSDSRIGAFDSISPPVVKRYSEQRVVRELEAQGIGDLSFSTPRTPPAPCYPLLEPLSRWLHGRYGGNFVLTGRRLAANASQALGTGTP